MNLSIIIVSWNVKDKLRDNLTALMQSKTDFTYEIIVVDNNSEDDTVAMVKKEFPQAHLLQNDINLGLSKAWNMALKQISSKYALIFNPDMVVRADTLQKRYDWMENKSQVNVAGCKLVNKTGETVRHVRCFPSFSDQLAIVLKLPHIFNTIGCPIFSAIACALTQVTGKPLTIEKIQSYENGEIIEVTYKIRKLEYQEQPESPLAEFIENVVSPAKFIERLFSPHPLSKLPSLILIVLGLITLVWIGQLTWYEMAVWQKSLDFILFGSRAGESIDLGIAMKVIYFYVIGLALIFSGTLIHLRKKRGKA